MKILRFFTVTLICLLIISCGGSGKNRKREPARKSKKNIEVIEKKRAITNDRENDEEQLRNNGNYRKPSQRERGESKLRRKTKGRPIVAPEEDPAKVKKARIEKRIQLELDIWEANKKGNQTIVEKLRKEADKLEKEMRQPELDEVYKRLKDIKKRM